MPGRKYTDKEVGQILSKAVALHSGISNLSAPQGSTLQELQRIGEEVGIDPKLVELAAMDLDNERQVTADIKSNTVLVEQSVSGDLPEETWESYVTMLRTLTGRPGKSEVNSRSREWVGGSEFESYVLTAVVRQGRTQLKLMGTRDSSVLWIFGFIGSVLLPMIPLIISSKHQFAIGPWWTFFFCIVTSLSVMFAAFQGIRHRRKTFASHVKTVMDQLIEVSEHSSEESLSDRLSKPITLQEPESTQSDSVSH